jgi:hypothetical protein
MNNVRPNRFYLAGTALEMLALCLLVAGCSASKPAATTDTGVVTQTSSVLSNLPIVGPGTDLHTQSVRSIKSVKVDRVAVMPIVEAAGPGQEVADGAGASLTAEIYSQMSLAAGWNLTPESDVEDQMQKLPPTTANNIQQNALQLARLLSVDAVVYGTVQRYRERVGVDYAAQTPASVAFSLMVIDAASKQVIWNAHFDRTQKALTENVLNVVSFLQNRGRWVRAHDIALEGVELAIGDLHSQLNLQSSVRRFEAGTYESMKSGGQRYVPGRPLGH